MDERAFGSVRLGFEMAGVRETDRGVTGSGAEVRVALPESPREYYHHGWQSWSPALWHEADVLLPVPQPSILHPLQTDPTRVRHRRPHGSWLGAVRLAGGEVVLLGALELDTWVELVRDDEHPAGRLVGHAETDPAAEPGDRGGTRWFVGVGDERAVFDAYARLLARELGALTRRPAPRVWCSWYSYYTAISERRLAVTLAELHGLPFDVVQVDDGWQRAVGDWTPNEKFPSGMETLAERIRATGRRAGLWLAPLVATASSRLVREHPDWLVREPAGERASARPHRAISAGFNWGEQLYAVDTTHPEAKEWLAELMRTVRGWGYDYIKLDFLYAGALPGVRHRPVGRERAYREGLAVLRDAMGEDAWFLTCGAPILPSIGLCDALRVGPDVAGFWERARDARLLRNLATPGTRNAIRTTVSRLWLEPLVAPDPDVVYFASSRTPLTGDERRALADLAHVCNYRATSDLPHTLANAERGELVRFLECNPEIERTGRYRWRVGDREADFGSAVGLPRFARGLLAPVAAIVGWIGSRRGVLRLLDRVTRRRVERELL